MKENWQEAMRIELVHEGGKVDDPRDPGGRTNQGVTQRVYSAWLKQRGQMARDVYGMTPAERDAIYFEQYGRKIYFDRLPSGVDLVVLDGAIHSGVSQSVKWVQRSLGLTADGVMADVTLQAIEQYPDNDALIAKILDRRMAFLKALEHWPTYKKGWTSRINQIRAKGQAWATGSVGPEPKFSIGGNKRALITQAVPPPSRAVGDVIGTGGTISSGLSTVQGYLEPLQGNPYIDKVVFGMIIGGAVLGVAGFAWSYYARQRKAHLEDVLDLVPQDAPNNNEATPTEILMRSEAPLEYQGAPNISKGV